MKLYLLKRDHQEGQDFYGVYESKELALKQIETLRQWYKYVPEECYIVEEIMLNELTEIRSL